MSSLETGTTLFNEAVRKPTLERYKQWLVPEALSAIRGAMIMHPRLGLHLDGVDKDRKKELFTCQDVGQFTQAWIGVFGDQAYHLLSSAKVDFSRYLTAAMTGHDTENISDLSDDLDYAVHITDIEDVARAIFDLLDTECSESEGRVSFPT